MKIRLQIFTAFAVLLTSLLYGCASSDSFKIKGKIKGDPDMNISITYYADEAVRSMVTVARKGNFEAECAAREPVLVSLTDGNGKLIGLVYATPGDKITCTIDRNNPFRISAKGNPLTERWSVVADSLADKLLNNSPREINTIVENYIASNPRDEISALLFAQCYDASVSPTRADSVLRAIAPEAQNSVFLDSYVTQSHIFADSASLAPIRELTLRTTDDSACHFNTKQRPLNFIAISGDRYDWRRDSVRLALRRQFADPRVQVLSLSVASDTFIWKRIVRQDSVRCLQAWVPGGELAPQIYHLAIPTLPFFIITDSLGNQLLRTPSLTVAEDFLKSKK